MKELTPAQLKEGAFQSYTKRTPFGISIFNWFGIIALIATAIPVIFFLKGNDPIMHSGNEEIDRLCTSLLIVAPIGFLFLTRWISMRIIKPGICNSEKWQNVYLDDLERDYRLYTSESQIEMDRIDRETGKEINELKKEIEYIERNQREELAEINKELLKRKELYEQAIAYRQNQLQTA